MVWTNGSSSGNSSPRTAWKISSSFFIPRAFIRITSGICPLAVGTETWSTPSFFFSTTVSDR